jgi:ribosomal protein L40E
MRKLFGLHWAELFWEDYVYLSDLRCVTSLGNSEIFQQLNDHSKICDNCYATLTPVVKLRYIHLYKHHLLHVNALRNPPRCTMCRKLIVMIRMAQSCQGCLDQFDHANRTLLNAGDGIPVIDSWSEEGNKITLG